MEKGDIVNNYQGLILKFDKNCPNFYDEISFLLGAFEFAYLNDGFAPPTSQLLCTSETCTLSFDPTIFISNAGVINGLIEFNANNTQNPFFLSNNTTNYSFRLSSSVPLVTQNSSGATTGLPVAFRARAIPIDPNPQPPVTIQNFVYNGIPQPPIDGWYIFPNGFQGLANNSSFDINLGSNPDLNPLDECYNLPFDVLFEFRVFCNQAQLDETPYPCNAQNSNQDNIYSFTQRFQRSTTNLGEANINNNFHRENCDLIWNLEVTNPSLIAIDVSTLHLNFATGLIYTGGTVNFSGCPNPSNGLSLSDPTFEYVTDDAGNNFIQTTIDIEGFGVGSPALLLPPGCTLQYSLFFSSTEEVCNSDYNNSSVLTANFAYSNICNDDTETPTNDGLIIESIIINNNGTSGNPPLSSILEQLSNGTNADGTPINGSPCCLASSFVLQHACGNELGSISYENTNTNDITLSLYEINAQTISHTILAGTTLLINLEEGNYGITVFNSNSGAYFTADITIENHGFNVELNDASICDGQNITLVPTLDPPTPPSGLEYTYDWGNSITTETLIVNSAANYSVNISNGSCSLTKDANLTVIPLPIVTNPSELSICNNTSPNILLDANLLSTYSWTIGTIAGDITGASQGLGSTIDQILVNTSNNSSGTVEYLVTPTTEIGFCAGTPFSINVTVFPTPSVSIAASQTTICAGTSVTFTATPTNGGTTPVYAWTVNGSPAGTNAATFTSTTLTNGDNVQVTMTSNLACASPLSVTSNTISMVVNGTVAPSVSISASQTTICAGTSVTFTATPTNGGTTPTYAWTVNGSPAGTNAATFTSTTLTNGANVQVTMTSDLACVSPLSAASNTISMVVNGTVAPSVSISASQTTICAGTSVTFTATAINGGTTPSFSWTVNGTFSVNSATFTTSTLTNGDQVKVVMFSSLGCVSPIFTISDPISMTVTPNVAPSVSITANPGNSICSGASVTFTATPTNGGATPSFDWSVNGIPAGTNAPTFTSSTLTSNDVVEVTMTSNAICSSPITAMSNSITMNVTETAAPSVSISASQTTICAGTSVTFTATPTNGGTTPTYAWTLNGSPAGTNAATFTSTTITNGANVQVTMTSNLACASPLSAASNTVIMVVNGIVAPSVSISASQSTICSGASVSFTATPTNGGTTPTYAWTVNGNTVGSNAATFTSSTLASNDVVEVTMTSSANCSSPSSASSNLITIEFSNSPLCQCACVDPNFGIIIPPTPITHFEDLVVLSGSTIPTISNSCLYFENDISINSSLSLIDCMITIAPGKKIVVEPGASFSAEGTTFRGCEQMWAGIVNKGTVKFKSNVIMDAHVGFELFRLAQSPFFPPPETSLINVTFSNNYIGLQNSEEAGNHIFPGPWFCTFNGGGLLDGYVGQTPEPNQLGGYTGILIQHRFSMKIDKSNTFDNLYNGVIVYKQSMVKIKGARFRNISFDATDWPNNLLYNNFNNTNYDLFPNYQKSPSAAVNSHLDCIVEVLGSGTSETGEAMFYGCNVSVYSWR
jgi:hypothetical protein